MLRIDYVLINLSYFNTYPFNMENGVFDVKSIYVCKYSNYEGFGNVIA